MPNKSFRLAATGAGLITVVQILSMASLVGINARVSAQTKAANKRRAPGKHEAGRVAESRRLQILPFRLRPGQDLRREIEAFIKANNVRAGFMLTAVGSLRTATIRLADQKEPTTFAGKFEIVSLVGTMGQDGVHLHISLADSTGKTVGGHLVDGCLVYTTVEIVVGEARGLTFAREQDEETRFKELRIRPAKL